MYDTQSAFRRSAALARLGKCIKKVTQMWYCKNGSKGAVDIAAAAAIALTAHILSEDQ